MHTTYHSPTPLQRCHHGSKTETSRVRASGRQLIPIAFFPILIFWILDGYLLSQERLFRALFDKIRKLPETDIDFSMDTRDL